MLERSWAMRRLSKQLAVEVERLLTRSRSDATQRRVFRSDGDLLATARRIDSRQGKHARHSVPIVAHEGRRKRSVSCRCVGTSSSGRIPTGGKRPLAHATVLVERKKRSIDKFLTQSRMDLWHRRVEGAHSITLRVGSFFLYNYYVDGERADRSRLHHAGRRGLRNKLDDANLIGKLGPSAFSTHSVLHTSTSVGEITPCRGFLCITKLNSSELHQTRR